MSLSREALAERVDAEASEVMSRITVHLTVSSAALVVLALVTQATGFGSAFHVLSIGLTSAILALGTLTGLRALDPGIAEYLVTSPHDDRAGPMATYTMGDASQHGQPRPWQHLHAHQHRERHRGRHLGALIVVDPDTQD